MSNKQRTDGRFIDIEDETTEPMFSSARHEGKVFDPLDTDELSQVPTSISGSAATPVTDYKLDKLPIKGLKRFTYASLGLITFVIGWELFSVYQQLSSFHWGAGVAFLTGIVGVVGLGLNTLRGLFADKENTDKVTILKQESEIIREANDKGKGKSFINSMADFYHDKPQFDALSQCLTTLPDYSNDKEIVKHLEASFIEKLDAIAFDKVTKHSLNTSMIVAASPWATVDMGLALWRCTKMIDDIGQIYGIRPSLANRYKLLQQVIRYLAFIGVSEVALSELMQELGTTSVAGIAGARLSQGVGAGVYTARIGLAVIHACRPIPFTEDKKPKMQSFISVLLQSLKKNKVE